MDSFEQNVFRDCFIGDLGKLFDEGAEEKRVSGRVVGILDNGFVFFWGGGCF